MGELRESSLSFSLESLLQLEEQRIEEQRAQRERELLEQARAQKLAAERLQQQELLESRRRAQQELLEARQRAEQERTVREQAARRDELLEQERERARLRASRQSELDAQRLEHERKLALIRAGAQSGIGFGWRALLGATLLAASLVGVYLVVLVPRSDDLRAREQALLTAQSEAEKQAQRLARDGELRRIALEKERETLRLRTQELEQRAPASVKPRPVQPASTRPKVPKNEVCTGDPADPMNFCLPGRR